MNSIVYSTKYMVDSIEYIVDSMEYIFDSVIYIDESMKCICLIHWNISMIQCNIFDWMK